MDNLENKYTAAQEEKVGRDMIGLRTNARLLQEQKGKRNSGQLHADDELLENKKEEETSMIKPYWK